VPNGGPWREIFNTDSSLYGGGNIGNAGQLWAHDESWAGRPHHLSLTIPPLGGVFLTPGS
jgi:1,4-alpha-glucan branching enzyme